MVDRGYCPLDVAFRQIRVLDLEPSKDVEALIQCRLRVVSLNEQPQYEALSYTWGAPEPMKTISLDGSSFEAQENLVAAFRRLRHASTTRTLWVDAICINQNDKVEKSVQVLRMGDIYKHAQHAVVWLGEPDDERNLAMQLITSRIGLSARLNTIRALRWHGLSIHPIDGNRTTWKSACDTEDVELGELGRLLDRPYFSRCWIQQEVVLAGSLIVMCGSIEGSWSSISAFLHNEGWRLFWNRSWGRPLSISEGAVYIAQHGTSGDNFILLDAMRAAKQSGSLPSIYKLLFENRRLSCVDARDRVYAFLSLIHENDQSIFKIDYRRSISQVYLDTARSLISAHGSLYVLNCRRTPASRGMDAGQNELYSPLDQARFVDPDSRIFDESGCSKNGWAKLPVGWERRVELVHDDSWYPGMSAVINFVDHSTGRVSKTSPLENISAVQPLHEDEWRRLPREWHKLWDNTGKLFFEYKATSSSSHSEDSAERLDLPTWVPNWNCYSTRDPALLLEFQKSAPVFWASGKGQKVELLPDTFSYSARVLKLRGVLYDEIHELGESWHPEPGMIPLSRSGIRALEQWDDIALRQPKACPYADANGRANAYWRTTIADHAGDAAFAQGDIQWFDIWCNRTNWLPEGHRPWAFSCVEIEEAWSRSEPHSEIAAMLELKSCIAEAYVFNSIDRERGVLHFITSVLQKSYQYGYGVYDDKNVEEVYKDFRARIVRACANRRILVSAKGYIGLAPWNARTGDTIAVLQGGCTPFLLRRVGQGYKLVGEIYVYGIMGGEVFQSKPNMEAIEIV